MKSRTSIPRIRLRPRRKRPELFFVSEDSPKLAPARPRNAPSPKRGTALPYQAGVGPGPHSRRAVRRVAKKWLRKPDVVVMRDGREICNHARPGGCAEYKWRVLQMWLRQNGYCCFREYDFCPGRMTLSQATFEHENKRAAGKRDDRIWDDDGRPLNGAAHLKCNNRAGSSRLPIWHGEAWQP